MEEEKGAIVRVAEDINGNLTLLDKCIEKKVRGGSKFTDDEKYHIDGLAEKLGQFSEKLLRFAGKKK